MHSQVSFIGFYEHPCLTDKLTDKDPYRRTNRQTDVKQIEKEKDRQTGIFELQNHQLILTDF